MGNRIKTQDVLDMLANGKDRATINKELGLTPADKKVLWNHPDLKNKKVQRPSTIVIEGIDGSVSGNVSTEISSESATDFSGFEQ